MTFIKKNLYFINYYVYSKPYTQCTLSITNSPGNPVQLYYNWIDYQHSAVMIIYSRLNCMYYLSIAVTLHTMYPRCAE